MNIAEKYTSKFKKKYSCFCTNLISEEEMLLVISGEKKKGVCVWIQHKYSR